MELLRKTMIRASKSDVQGRLLPSCFKHIVRLPFDPEHQACYNLLIEVATFTCAYSVAAEHLWEFLIADSTAICCLSCFQRSNMCVEHVVSAEFAWQKQGQCWIYVIWVDLICLLRHFHAFLPTCCTATLLNIELPGSSCGGEKTRDFSHVS